MNTVPYRLTPAMLHSIDAEGRILGVSDLWLEKLGYERDEVVGRRSTDFLTPASQEHARGVLQDFFATGRCDDVPYDFVKKDGSILPVRLSGTAEFDADGTYLRSFAVMHDVTELVAMQNRLLESQKLESLGMLSSGIAHDFNNLLVAILGNAEIAQLDNGISGATAKGMRDIVGAATQAAALCRQLLDYSGRGRFLVRDVALSTLVRETVRVLEVTLGPDTTLHFDLASPSPVVKADPSQIHQIVMNLVTNAAHAMRAEGGLVTVATASVLLDHTFIRQTELPDVRPGAYAAIMVSDQGCGMSSDVRAKMFDPFFTTKEEGSGLGLAAVHGIVRAHKGTMHVFSELGRGTTVKVFLPSESSPELIGKDSSRMVLVVDDDDRVRLTAARILEASGFDVMLAASGEEAIHAARMHSDALECVLMDVSMPGCDGPTAYEQMRASMPDIRVLFMSGYDQTAMLQKGKYGATVGFLSKPFAMQQLVSGIDQLLSASLEEPADL